MNRLAEAAEYVERQAQKIERALRNSFDSSWPVPPVLAEAMQYSLFAGGKRLRPILTLAAAESLGGSEEAALPVACAIEMVHTYSLIHDDLPAMDNDDYRRGKLTNHKVYGEAMAILAGDGLLTHAFYCIAGACRRHGIPAERALDIIADLAYYAGPAGMVGGQAADMLGEQGVTRKEELDMIHRRKTGDLIVCALKAGGRIAGAGEEELAALERFGYSIGLAFQIQDDILDMTGDAQKLGKPVRSDERRQKVTYPYLIGLEPSKEMVRRLTAEGREAVASLPVPDRLLLLADYLMARDH